RYDLEYAFRQLENGNVERAAAEVLDRVDALGRILQPVGDGRGGGLVEQAQHVQAGDAARIFRRLPLRVVEVGGHGDDGAGDIALQGQLRTLSEDSEDLRGNFNRALDAGHGAQLQHARRIDEI